MSFNVINLQTGKPIEDASGVLVFETGQLAAAAAAAHSDATGTKHQPRRVVVDSDWRARERKRFEDGTYTAVPWSSESWSSSALFDAQHAQWGYGANYSALACTEQRAAWEATKDHFAHVSTEEPGKLAFTADGDKGVADRQTRIRPGRYLQQFFGNVISSQTIKDLAGRFAAQYEPTEVKFADTPDEIERVYVNGPSSCMSHPASQYSGHVHPVRVYGAGDLAVAYIQHEDCISARCVCWPERKLYSRVYGYEDVMCAALDKLGYTKGELIGARLLRIEGRHGGFVMPYIDETGSADDNGGYLIIARGGDIDCQSTNGLTENNLSQCDNCGDRYDGEEEGSFIEDVEEYWCTCCSDAHAFYCDSTSRMLSIANSGVRMANGDIWSTRRFENEGAMCDATGDCYPIDDLVSLEDGTCWSSDYFAEHGFQCRTCSECHQQEDHKQGAESVPYCDDCAPAEEEESTDDATPVHTPRQGRDESPDQLEAPIGAIALALDHGFELFVDGGEWRWKRDGYTSLGTWPTPEALVEHIGLQPVARMLEVA